MNLSDRIRQAREKQGMTQENLAERMDVSRQAVSKWELGGSLPSPENLLLLSTVLEADFSSGKDVCAFCYKEESHGRRWQKIGPTHQLIFGLDHFCGCRFGLVVYSTKEAGGIAGFREFIYRESDL